MSVVVPSHSTMAPAPSPSRTGTERVRCHSQASSAARRTRNSVSSPPCGRASSCARIAPARSSGCTMASQPAPWLSSCAWPVKAVHCGLHQVHRPSASERHTSCGMPSASVRRRVSLAATAACMAFAAVTSWPTPPIRVTRPASSRMGKSVLRSQRSSPSEGRRMRYSKVTRSPALTRAMLATAWARSSGTIRSCQLR